MTAYGRSSLNASFGYLTVEIQSVNRKHLDMLFSLPKEFARFEIELRNLVTSHVHRGQLTVRIQATYTNETPIKVVPNIPLAKELKTAWDAISQALGMNTSSHFHLEMLAHESELFSYHEELEQSSVYRDALHQGIQEALTPFLAMRKQEGEVLKRDILKRLALMRTYLEKIAARTENAPTKYRDKLMHTLSQIGMVDNELEERLLREVSLFADRIDIVEELTRAHSHLIQLETTLNPEAEKKGLPIGKTLEFLLQEIFREINTIASKSLDTEISHTVVAFKGEIERIREQVQNIE